jgi:hypothetical protein
MATPGPLARSLGSILNDLAALLEEEIDLLASPLFWSHGWAVAAGSSIKKSRRILRNWFSTATRREH